MEYLSTLLILAVFLSFASMLSPMKEKIKRACLSAFSVIFLLSLIPKDADFSFRDLISVSVDEIPDASEDYRDAWQEGIEAGLLKDLVARFSLNEENIVLESRIAHAENTVTIEYLSVTLTGKNICADVPGIALYIQKNYGCHSEIHIKGE